MFFMIDDASTAIIALMYAGPHFFTPDNCLLYMDAPPQTSNLFAVHRTSWLSKLLWIAWFRIIKFYLDFSMRHARELITILMKAENYALNIILIYFLLNDLVCSRW